MSEDEKQHKTGPFTAPELPPPAERSLELPAVIIGDRGQKSAQPLVRLLPGRVPESLVLYPAYTLVGAASLLVSHFALNTGELNPFMALTGWGLLYCWYWVYGVAYRYRRSLMKYFALLMSAVTALSLTWVSALRSTSMHVPVDGELVLRGPAPTMLLAALLTAVSLAGILTHAAFLGRGYRERKISAPGNPTS